MMNLADAFKIWNVLLSLKLWNERRTQISLTRFYFMHNLWISKHSWTFYNDQESVDKMANSNPNDVRHDQCPSKLKINIKQLWRDNSIPNDSVKKLCKETSIVNTFVLTSNLNSICKNYFLYIKLRSNKKLKRYGLYNINTSDRET